MEFLKEIIKAKSVLVYLIFSMSFIILFNYTESIIEELRISILVRLT
jgi:hypothetical protein